MPLHVTEADKLAALSSYPFYAEAALAWHAERIRVETCEEEIAAAVGRFAMRADGLDLFFVERLVKFAEAEATRIMAGIMLGMTPKARQQWIEENAR